MVAFWCRGQWAVDIGHGQCVSAGVHVQRGGTMRWRWCWGRMVILRGEIGNQGRGGLRYETSTDTDLRQ